MSLCSAMVMAGVLADADIIVGLALKRVRKRDLLCTHADTVCSSHTHTHALSTQSHIIKHTTEERDFFFGGGGQYALNM